MMTWQKTTFKHICNFKGLKSIHSLGDAHFAINPWNIFFVRRDTSLKFVIGDFGLSLHSERRRETKIYVGGPHTRYFAPEVLKNGKGQYIRYYDRDALCADIYSLGVIFKELRKHIGKNIIFLG